MTDMEVLREIEVAWLSDRLSESITNLGYPVGCGIAPHPEQIAKAANILFDRYAKMIEMARESAKTSAEGTSE